MVIRALSPSDLYTSCDTDQFTFATTAELEDLPGLVGQERALEAIRFGTRMRRSGFNLFVLGPQGAGKHEAVRRYLAEQGGTSPAGQIADWVYVNNFDTPHQPISLKMKPGGGRALKRTLSQLLSELKIAVPAIIESDEYQARRKAIDENGQSKQEEALEALRKKAEGVDVALLRTPNGFTLAPIAKKKVLKPEEFNALPEAKRLKIEQQVDELQTELAEIFEQVPGWEKKRLQQVVKLNTDVAKSTVSVAMQSIKNTYKAEKEVSAWLAQVEEDLVKHIHLFVEAEPHIVSQEEQTQQALQALANANAQNLPVGEQGSLLRYEVNVLVENTADEEGKAPPPVVYEDHPSFANLVGRVEHIAQMGALTTDFTLIKPGAMHRANGGYLLLDAERLLREPLAWDALKRILRAETIKVENPGDYLNLVSTVSLEPAPIPLDVKIIIFGERELYYLLCRHDPEFSKLFKVAADFDDVIEREPENDQLFARLIASLCRQDNLLHLDRSAVARAIERAARNADDSEKLSIVFGPLADVIREADFVAREAGDTLIGARHIDAALDAQVHRHDRIRERAHESITRDIILIDTEGAAVGQVNGLSVLQIGDTAFGKPSRITARVRMGTPGARLIDIEREVDLGGPLHSKGVMILGGYLAGQFLPHRQLSLSASLVFEQSYGGVDGDSASSAELYTLLSALSGVPIHQGLAVTGSVNQFGDIQPIGGANEKIEGFFEICQQRGLTGDQGVLIPAANVKHLMLRQDVVDAVERGMFSVYPIERVEEGIELLTGMRAGKRGVDGRFPPHTIFQRVEERLHQFGDASSKTGRSGSSTFGYR